MNNFRKILGKLFKYFQKVEIWGKYGHFGNLVTFLFQKCLDTSWERIGIFEENVDISGKI